MLDNANPLEAGTSPAVEVTGLVVRRGGQVVLDALDCRIGAGRVTGLIGPSGSGKTTLMRAIVGVQRISAGRVTVLGCAAGSPSLRHRIGYMAQERGVYTDLTVRENVRYFARLHRGVTNADADAMIDDVGLAAEADLLVGGLSAGQVSRTSLACALLGRPDLLVLDEPTVGQDPVLRHDLWQRFHSLADSGVALLVSSHDMAEARLCDELLLVRDGTILASGPPDRLRADAGTADLNAAFLRLVRTSSGSRPTSTVKR